MNYTQNYQLPQWVETDRIMMDDFNDSYQKLEAALSGHDQDLSALQTQVTGAVDAVAEKGNCQIYKTLYTGTGTCGAGAPLRMTFPAKPIFVLIVDSYNSITFRMINGITQTQASNTTVWCTVGWSGNLVGWYADNAAAQMNAASTIYHMVALLQCD